MAPRQRGFTMIELIVVIVILGILAATALPRFLDLRDDALTAAANGVAAQLATSVSVNYAACASTGNQPTAGKCTTVSDCSHAAGLLAGGALPTDGNVTYQIVSQAIGSGGSGANGATGTCTLSATKGGLTKSVTFPGISAGL